MNQQLTTINGVRGYIDENGTAQLHLEDVAKGLGFTQVKNDVLYVRWERVEGYLYEFKFSPLVGKEGFVPENIFYRLSMKANNNVGNNFQEQVANEILPSIRKHGAYMTPEKIEEVLADPDTIIMLATKLKQERADRVRIEAANVMLESTIEKQKPFVAFAELCMQSTDSIKVRDFAHSLASHGVKIGQNKLYDKLRDWNFTCIKGTEPTQRAINQGIFEIVTGVKQKPSGEPFTWRTPYVTVKGQVYIADRLKKEAI